MVTRYLILLHFLVSGAPALAQSSWDVMFWNPQEQPGDIVLPAPCEGAMVFRRVDTTLSNNWLSDTDFQMGNTDVAGQEHAEAVVTEGLAGGLSDGRASDRFYLIGKYEVSTDQYNAVMQETCPTESDEGSHPAEGMSWFDAQTFTAKYTTWLYKNAAEKVVRVAGAGAFVRLPTEAEWEFAARGGLTVNDGARRQKLFDMEGPLEDYVWFSGFKSCDGLTQPIGLLEPNPLGLFDILGNVQEMTNDHYRLRKRERLHGQVGGIVARGGSCLTLEGRVRLSERDEVALFDRDTGAPRGKGFTGFRLAFGSPILTTENRISSINEGWFRLSDGRLEIDPNDDPIRTLAAIAEAEQDVSIREALERARALFSLEMERRNEIEAKSAKSIIQGGFLAARNYIIEYEKLLQFEEALKDIDANAGDDSIANLEAAFSRSKERLLITESVLMNAIVQSSEIFSEETFGDAMKIAQQENRLQFQSMSETTRASSVRLLSMFGEFSQTYRERSDTNPNVFFQRLQAYFEELVSRYE